MMQPSLKAGSAFRATRFFPYFLFLSFIVLIPLSTKVHASWHTWSSCMGETTCSNWNPSYGGYPCPGASSFKQSGGSSAKTWWVWCAAGDPPCPDGKEWSNTALNEDGLPGGCANPDGTTCKKGSLRQGCAVQCSKKEYTYYKDGILRKGSIGAGQVGYGQSCPTPNFPPGTELGCVGTPGQCNDFDDPKAVDEREDVTKTDKTETQDGNTKTVETGTTTSKGHDSSGGSNPGGGGSAPVDTEGNEVSQGMEGLSDKTVDIGETTFATCEHGGIVDGTIGCDYVPPSCASNEIATSYGCIAKPESEKKETTPSKREVTTTDPQTGETTTETIETQGLNGDGQSPSQVAENETQKEQSSVSGGQSCGAPPVCQGDAIQCAILQQEYLSRCPNETFEAPVLGDTAQKLADIKQEFESEWNTVKSELESHFNFNLSGGGNIPTRITNIFGVEFDFSMSRFLPYLAVIATLIVAVAWLIAVQIVLTRR